MRKPFWHCTIACIAFTLTACSTPENAPNHFEGLEYPDWVLKGSGNFGGEAGRVFYGVGSASGIKNHSLARDTAGNRARNEIAKIFNVYSASLMKDYMAATTAGDMSASSEEQHVEQAIKTFVAEELSGIEVAEYWFHPDGTVYALARMDLEKFTDAFTKMKELSAQVRDYVRKNAERVHLDLENEEEKHGKP
ncbi:LPP20 family lipoprotein [Myxococcota bacterium]